MARKVHLAHWMFRASFLEDFSFKKREFKMKRKELINF